MAQSVVPSRWEGALWPVLLVALSAVASLGFACVTPFPALVVAAASVLPRRSALTAVAGVWLANQAIGYAALDYSWSLDTALWGLAIGAAALLATAAASAALRGIRDRGIGRSLGIALPAAFGVYEAALLLVTPVLGGEEAFAPAIVGTFALLNLGWALALLGAVEAWRSAGAWALRLGGGRAEA